MEVPLYRWMVYVMENANRTFGWWLGGTPISGNLQAVFTRVGWWLGNGDCTTQDIGDYNKINNPRTGNPFFNQPVQWNFSYFFWSSSPCRAQVRSRVLSRLYFFLHEVSTLFQEAGWAMKNSLIGQYLWAFTLIITIRIMSTVYTHSKNTEVSINMGYVLSVQEGAPNFNRFNMV